MHIFCRRGRNAAGSFSEVLFTHDIVAVEDAAGFVTANPHGDHFRHSGPDHISDRCPSEVAKEPSGQASLLTCLSPTLPEVSYLVARLRIDEDPRDDFSPLSR